MIYHTTHATKATLDQPASNKFDSGKMNMKKDKLLN